LEIIDGETAINPKKTAPMAITRLIRYWRRFSVAWPGRMPGIKPPDLRSSSAISLGLKMTEV